MAEWLDDDTPAMTLKTCLRCDWQGETMKPRCPDCEEQLYVVPASPSPGAERPVGGHPAERSREAPSTARTATPDTPSRRSEPPPPTADAVEPSSRSHRSVVAFVLAAVVLTVILGTWINGREAPSAPAASTGAAQRSVTLPGDGSSTQPPQPPPRTATIGSPKPVGIGRQSLSVGMPLSFRVPSGGWQRFGDLYVSKSTVGSQGAEAIVFWTEVWRSNGAHACGQWWGSPVGSIADWAEQASMARGTKLVTGPVEVTIGGYPAQHVVFTVRKDVACNPGFFHTWQAVDEGPFWSSTEVGDTIRIWLVKVGEEVLFIEGDTHMDAGADLEQDVERIVASVAFD